MEELKEKIKNELKKEYNSKIKKSIKKEIKTRKTLYPIFLLIMLAIRNHIQHKEWHLC